MSLVFVKEATESLNEYIKLKKQEEEIVCRINELKEQFNKWLEANKIEDYILTDENNENWHITKTRRSYTKVDTEYLKTILSQEQLNNAIKTLDSEPYLKITKVSKKYNSKKSLKVPGGE